MGKQAWNLSFKAEIVARGMTAKDVSDKTGIPTKTILNYYQGNRRPTDRNKVILRDALGIDINTFFIGLDEQQEGEEHATK